MAGPKSTISDNTATGGKRLLDIDRTSTVRTASWYDQLNVLMRQIVGIAATRTITDYDDSGIAILTRTLTLAGNRAWSWADEAGHQAAYLRSTASGHLFQVFDTAATAVFEALATSSLRLSAFIDGTGQALRSFNVTTLTRTVTDDDTNGVTRLLVTLLAAQGNYLFGPAAGGQLNIDAFNLKMQALNASSVAQYQLDFATGAQYFKLTTGSGASPETANTPTGTFLIKAGTSSTTVNNSLLASGDLVSVWPITRDATGIIPVVAPVTSAAFTCTVAANATGDTTIGFQILKKL